MNRQTSGLVDNLEKDPVLSDGYLGVELQCLVHHRW
jgi:hypothetical protein